VLTPTDDVGRFHPAVVGRRRCLALVEFNEEGGGGPGPLGGEALPAGPALFFRWVLREPELLFVPCGSAGA
jgi:hypothetical protein